jgi:hypothetical protein
VEPNLVKGPGAITAPKAAAHTLFAVINEPGTIPPELRGPKKKAYSNPISAEEQEYEDE